MSQAPAAQTAQNQPAAPLGSVGSTSALPTTQSRPLRVLLLIDALGAGGAERLMVPLATGLRARGIDARVMHLQSRDGNPRAEELRAASVPVSDLGLVSLLDPRPLGRLLTELRRERIDVLHTHLRYAGLLGAAAGALAKVPVVSTIHTIVETESGWRATLRRELDYFAARALVSRVIAVSETQRRDYGRRVRLNPRQIETHFNGVDMARFRPNPQARLRVRAAFGIAPGSPLFVTAVVLRPGKGIDHLLQAAALLRQRAPTARTLVAGDGPDRAALEALASSLGVRDVVHFLGTRSDVADILAAADAYVQPSLFEALPTSVLEAMSVGLPVVASRVGGIPEMVADGQSGALVPAARPAELAEAMAGLLEAPIRARMGAHGRAWVRKHASTEVWLDNIQQVYDRVVERDA